MSIAPSIGNIAFRMIVKGHDVLRWPHADMAAFKANPNMTGIPFMGPWINRLDEQAFYANGKRYPFDMTLGNVRGDIPIHGFLTSTSEWRVVSVDAGSGGATVTSRLEFFRQPSWMKQWPFAHTIDMTYRLSEGTLEVETTIANMSAEPMPVSIGFHPYFQLTDSPRDEWTISVGARTHLKLTPNKLPTGETEPIGAPFTGGVPLRDYDIDDGFSDLVRDAQGRATMSVIGKSQRIDVRFGPELSRRRRLVAEAAQLHLLRADGGDHQRAQPRAEGRLQGAAEHPARRHVARELLDLARAGSSDQAGV